MSSTPGQLRVLAGIARFTQRNGYPPTVRDLCALLGLRSPNAVHEHLSALRWNRLVANDADNRARTLRLTALGEEELEKNYRLVGANRTEGSRA